MWPASWKNVNQKRSLRFPRRLRQIIALLAVSHFAAPLTGAPLISGTRASATPAAAQSSSILGTNTSGPWTVSFLISSSAARNLALSSGFHSIFGASSSPSRSHVAIAPSLPLAVGDLRNANWCFDQPSFHASTEATPKNASTD